ncbi:hypothetical protein SH2C18_01340 [Clostridium sediminicola]|uniref:hypothetical protein n=1 Tax=Clostridium sediminicola TaxID=3114879 RepID=UPI0031F2494C
MYCVIQKVQNKRANTDATFKELKVSETTTTIENDTIKRYGFYYTGERFEREKKDAYKISIHKSYREEGKIKKKQWVICTMKYYDITDGYTYIGDYTVGLEDKLQEIGITEEKLYEMIYKKLDSIIDEITEEYKKTEEYKTNKKHKDIIKIYNTNKKEFEKNYGYDTYDYCYDVFGTLRNKEKLHSVMRNKREKQKNKRSYYENNESNYNYSDFSSSYFEGKQSNYTKEEKEYLKIIYKAAAMKLHPDIKKDNGEGMKFLNKLKEEWNL